MGFNCYPENFNVDNIQESFNKLVNGRFVERCPAPEPFLAPPSEEETPTKKRGAKSTKVVTFTFQPSVRYDNCFYFVSAPKQQERRS